MNWLLIAIAILFFTSVIVGICRGAIKIAVSLVTTIITIVLVFFLTPYVSQGLQSYTPIEDVIEEQVASTISDVATSAADGVIEEASDRMGVSEDNVKKVLKAAGVTEEDLAAAGITVTDIADGKVNSEELAEYGISSSLLDGFDEDTKDGAAAVLEELNIPKDIQIKAIENSSIPNIFKDLLLTNNNETVYDKLGVNGFVGYVAKYTSELIVNIIAFLLTFLVVTIILRAIIFALDIVSDLPVVGAVNRIAGGVLGGAGALIIIWFIFVIITLLYTTAFGAEMMALIRDNVILQTLYDYNPILSLATMLR